MRAPWHLWLIGILAVLWHIGGVSNYIGVQFRLDFALSQMDDRMLAFFDNAPAWYDAAWAFGVWFGLIGSLLLLLRHRAAAGALTIALIGLLLASIHTFFLAEESMMADATTGQMAFTALIYVVLILLIYYARALGRSGVLR